MADTVTTGFSPSLESRCPAGYVQLTRRGPEARAQAGCILALAAILLVLGCGAIAVFIHNPAGKGDPWVMPIVGGAFALVGAVLLFAGVRGARGSSIPTPGLYLEGPACLSPGTGTHLRIRQPGPVHLEELKVTLVCERVYRRRVRPNSASTVEDQDLLQEHVVLAVRNERVGRLEALEREVDVVLPSDAPPTGPAQPDGTIRWTFEVRGEAGFMRVTYHPFEILVARSDQAS